jgi:mannose-6-phosphate isomerase
MAPEIVRLENGIQPYAWGSTTALAEFLGRTNPEGRLQAELWIGAHPVLPSRALTSDGPLALSELIRRAPEATLGREAVARHGAELPFLSKVLAVAAPLSIQCHPNREQAREGFERENRLGVPLDAPQRNYRDPNHKPELIVALTRFTALRGFRPVEEALDLLRQLDAPTLTHDLGALERSGAEGLRSFFTTLMSLPHASRRDLAAQAARVARPRRERDLAWEWVGRLAERYPEDVGVLSPLYLNLVVLEPERALYLPAGELHAYLEGLGVEIMANSANVLRGGLTPKHVDVPELLRLLSFRAAPPEVLTAAPRPDGARVYVTPAEEFELGLLRLGGAPHDVAQTHGAEILLVLEGAARVLAGNVEIDLARGQTAFVPAAAGAYRLQGDARIARARIPGRRHVHP